MKQRHLLLMGALVLGLMILLAPLTASADATFPSPFSITLTEGAVETGLGTLSYPDVASAGLQSVSIKTPYTDLVSASGQRIPTTLKVVYANGTVKEMKQTGTTVDSNGMPVLYANMTLDGRVIKQNNFPVSIVLGVSADAWAAAEAGSYSAEVTYELHMTDTSGNQTTESYWQSVSVNVVKIPIDTAHFPDPVFCEALHALAYDLNQDGYLSGEEINSLTFLFLQNRGISSLEGIQYLTAVDELAADGNNLTSLDLSRNTALKNVYVSRNQLTSLDVSSNYNLEVLYCSYNQLKTLNIGGVELTGLDCSNNQLTSLIVKSTVIHDIECINNNLYMLSIPYGDKLDYLKCYHNPGLKFLDISRCSRILSAVKYGSESTETVDGFSYLHYQLSAEYTNTNLWVDTFTQLITTKLKGWQKFGRYWYYFDEYSGALISQFAWLEENRDKLYYFDEYGIMQNGGWKKVGGYWYYFNTSGAAAIGWKQIDGEWYFFERYFGSLVQNDFVTDNGKTYYMTGSGAMATGWRKINDKWYYFDPGSGAMAKYAWKEIEGEWYWFNSEGQMVTGLQTINGKVYYFTSGGQMVTGWKTIDGKKYYFTGSGAAAKGWAKIDGKTYYFKADCVMAASEYWDGWWLNADGTWTYPYQAHWEEDMHGWYYMDTSGWYAKNATYMIDGVSYTFNAQGYRVP